MSCKNLKPGGKTLLFLAALSFFLFPACAEKNPQKVFWKAEKLKRAAISDKKVEGSAYDKARKAYRKFLKHFPDSDLTSEAKIAIGELFAFEGNIEEAEKSFQNIMLEKNIPNEIKTRALFGLGQIKEKEGDDVEALANYRKLIENYPTTTLGFRTPFYVARHPKADFAGLTKEARYQEAISFYEKIVYINPESPDSLTAMGYLFQIHADIGEWGKAIGVLKTIQRTFPGTREAELARLNEEKYKDRVKK